MRILFSVVLLISFFTGFAQLSSKDALSPWKEGYLDIHHINTGRGNAAFFILPDGTTMLIDAGELSPLDERTFTPRNASVKPDSSRKPYEWIVSYIQKVSPVNRIDYALITHFHDDHFGAWYPAAPLSLSGKYRLTGIAGVGSMVSIGTLIDRGAPDYNYPYNMRKLAASQGGGEIEFGETMRNYFSFQEEQKRKGMKIASLLPGSKNQLRLLNRPASYPSFYIRNVKCNQWIWTGRDSSFFPHFPPVDSSDKKTWPDENSLSLALTINYGPFSYYTGGDNPGVVFPGDNPLRDVETPIAKAIGEVDIAVTDHHANRDAVNEFMARTLRPSVWIGQTWSADHPGHEALLRMTSRYYYNASRDLFATNMLDANRYVIGPLIDRSYKSQQGHIVVRVMPGGTTYYIIILDDSTPDLHVKASFGPYQTKINKAN